MLPADHQLNITDIVYWNTQWRPRDAPSLGRMKLNETKLIRWEWENGGMIFVTGENERNPEKNLPRLRFVRDETHMEWPRCELQTPAVEGEHLTACATEPPKLEINYLNCFLTTTMNENFLNVIFGIS